MFAGILLIILILSVIGIVLLHVNIAFLIIDIVLCALMILLHLIFQRKLHRAILVALELVIACVCIFLGFKVTGKENDYSVYDYRSKLASVESEITKMGKNAEEDIDKLEEIYGTTDEIINLRAYYQITQGKYNDAEWTLRGYKNPHTVDYYTRLEAIYICGAYSKESFYTLYCSAAEDQPYWLYAQKMAGKSCFERTNLTGAKIYFTRALEINPSDAETLYYLGAVSYTEGDFDRATKLFTASLNAGADKELQSYIMWYATKMTE